MPQTFNPSTQRGQIFVSGGARLVYIMSSRPAGAIQWDSLASKKEGIKVEKYWGFYESIKYTHVQSLHLVAFSYTVYKNPFHKRMLHITLITWNFILWSIHS